MIGQLTIVGGKGSSGEYEGNKYDSTKLNVLLPFSRTNKKAFGFDTSTAKFGDEHNAAQFVGKHYPLVIEADYEMVPSGQGVIIEIYEVIKIHERPAQAVKPA